jgi:hypothetical protein
MSEIIDVPGRLGYGLSRDGRVWSKRKGGKCLANPFRDEWRPLKGRVNKRTGYLEVNLSIDSKTYFSQVHVLMAETFLGPKPSPNHEVRHLDGVQLNNAWDNLAWGTPLENHEDRRRHGTSGRGESNSMCSISGEKVEEILEFLESGGKQCEAVRIFSVSSQHISNIFSGKRRSHA